MLSTSETPRPPVRISRYQSGQISVTLPDTLLEQNLSSLGDWARLAVYAPRTSGLSQQKSELLLTFRSRAGLNKVRGERHLVKGIEGEHRAEFMLPDLRILRSPISRFVLAPEDIAWVPSQDPGKPSSVTLVIAVPRELLTYPVGTTAPLPLAATPPPVSVQEPIVAGRTYERPEWIAVSVWRAQDRSLRRNAARIGAHPRLSIQLSEGVSAQFGWRTGETVVSVSDIPSSQTVVIRPASDPFVRSPLVTKNSTLEGGVRITRGWDRLHGNRKITKRAPVRARWTPEDGLQVTLDEDFFVDREEASAAPDTQDVPDVLNAAPDPVSARLAELRATSIVRSRLAVLKSLPICREVVLMHREDILEILRNGQPVDRQVEEVADALAQETLFQGANPDTVRTGLIREIRALVQNPSAV